MSETNASADRREQILGEVAEGLHAVFKETQRRAMEAEDNDEFIRLSGSLHKIARGLRQSLALHARFERDRREGLEGTPAPAEAAPLDPRRQAIQKRRRFIARGVERCVWTEYDRDDEDEEHTAVSLLRDLDDRLDDLAEDDAFLDADADALIAEFCREIGVDPPARPSRTALSSALAPRANGHHPPPADSS